MAGGDAPGAAALTPAGAEVHRLAHQLGVDVAELAYLSRLPVHDVIVLRSQIGEALFVADRHRFSTVVRVSRALPVAVSARIAQVALSPLVAARVAEVLEPARAAQLVARLSTRYLADVASAMAPSRSRSIVAALPPERVVDVARELCDRNEWIIMGGFVAHIGSDALRATLARLSGEQLLRVACQLTDAARLDELVAMLADEQLAGVLRAAADGALWSELGDLLERTSPAARARLATSFATSTADLGEAVRAASGAGALPGAAGAVLLP